jgi:serine protease Do
LTATLSELHPESAAPQRIVQSRTRGRANREALDGVEVDDLNAQIRRELGMPPNLRGALVSKVDPDSPAGEAGLKKRDVILEINRQPVRDAEEAVALSGRIKGDRVLLRIWTQGEEGGPGGMRYLAISSARRR